MAVDLRRHTIDLPVSIRSATRPRRGILPEKLTVETSLYATFIAAAIVSRFWDLGSRALHHDEVSHAYYSWLFATGDGYAHHPLTHGPFLFHGNTLIYLLFGDSDASSRYLPALFGVVMVALPFLLRGPRHLGRWGALVASFLFLVSPSFLYYSRFIRHDLYTTVGTLLLFICIVRYVERPHRRWLVIAGATIGFLFANHEIIVAILAIFGAILYSMLIGQRLNAWWTTARRAAILLLTVHIAAVTAAIAFLFLVPGSYRAELLAIPWDGAGLDAPRPTRENQLHYYHTLASNPIVLGLAGIASCFAAALALILVRFGKQRRDGVPPAPSLAGFPRRTLASAFQAALADRVGLLISAFTAMAIAVLLFTSLFTNLHGLATATIATDGTLLYWLGQHDVRRGDQPWFYFLLLVPQYELFLVFFGLTAVAATAAGALRYRASALDLGTSLGFRTFLAVWFLGILAVLSWAGEKMPWLMVHIVLPGILLAAGAIGKFLDQTFDLGPNRIRADIADRQMRPHLPVVPIVSAAILVAGASWFVIAANLTYPVFERDAGGIWRRIVDPAAATDWWRLAVPPSVVVVLVVLSVLLYSRRSAAKSVVGALLIGLVVVQVHLGWRVGFLEGDVAKEMLIYNTTSPDVTMLTDDLTRLSAEVTGGNGLEIWYNSCTSWPMMWYLRDFPNSHAFSAAPGAENPPILIAHEGGECPSVSEMMTGYLRQEYVLRWHAPENTTYRNFAIAPELAPDKSAWRDAARPHGPVAILGSIAESIGTLRTVEGQQRLYRLLMYQELPSPTWDFRLTLYVRPDLVPLYNRIRY